MLTRNDILLVCAHTSLPDRLLTLSCRSHFSTNLGNGRRLSLSKRNSRPAFFRKAKNILLDSRNLSNSARFAKTQYMNSLSAPKLWTWKLHCKMYCTQIAASHDCSLTCSVHRLQLYSWYVRNSAVPKGMYPCTTLLWRWPVTTLGQQVSLTRQGIPTTHLNTRWMILKSLATVS